jgi:hypothetical protein
MGEPKGCGFVASNCARDWMSESGHFRTKSPLIIARISWSRPPTGADVSGALGKGRRVRLVFFSRAHHPTASRRCRRLVAVGSDTESSASAKAQGDVQEGRRARRARPAG